MKPMTIPQFVALMAVACDAFAPVSRRPGRMPAVAIEAAQAAAASQVQIDFLESLDRPYDMNARSESRTQRLYDMIEKGEGTANPGSQFASVAPGLWKVVYAPHMVIMAGLLRGEFSVQYALKDDGTIISHARYNFPLFNLYGYLSVSGAYGSVNNQVCRVDFDEAWVRAFDDDSFEHGPYPDIASVPDSISKSLIRNIGRAMFIEPLAVFPVSYLDDELIVFDFELFGTRICARKES